MNSLKSSVKTITISVQFKKTLIMKVKEHPIVWKKTETVTVDSLQRLEAWKSIEREMGFLCSLKDIQATWASLSEMYFRIIFLKTIERNFEAPVWQFFHDMSFLYYHVKETIQNMLGGISPPLFKPKPNSKESQATKCPCCVYDGPGGNPEPNMSSVKFEFKEEDEAENITYATKEASLENNENSNGSVDSEKIHTINSIDDMNSIAKSPKRDLTKDKTGEVIQLINETEIKSESTSTQLPPTSLENVTDNHSSKNIIRPLQENSQNSIGSVEKVSAVSSLETHSSKNQSKFFTNSPKLQQNGNDNSLAKLPSKDSMKDKTIKVVELVDDSETSCESTNSYILPTNLKDLTGKSKKIIYLPLRKTPLENIKSSIGSEKPYAISSIQPNIFINSRKLHPNDTHNSLAKSTSTNLMKDNTVEVIELIDENEMSSVSTSSQFPLAILENVTDNRSSQDIILPLQEKSLENIENCFGFVDSEKIHAVCSHNIEKRSELLTNARNAVNIIELIDDNETSSESTSSQLHPANLGNVTDTNSSKDSFCVSQSKFLTISKKQNDTNHSLAKSPIKDLLKEKTAEVIELIDDNETSNESTISQPQPASHENVVTESHSSKDIICRHIQENHWIGGNSPVGLIKMKSFLSINDYLEDDCFTNTEVESHSIEQTQSPGLSMKDSKGVLVLSDKTNGKSITRLLETVNKLRAIKRTQIIEAIKANPATYLYNGIKKKRQFHEAWNKVAKDLGNIPLEALKNRWKLIKARYLKELIFERYGKQKPSWECFDQLEFLRPHMEKTIAEINLSGVQMEKPIGKRAEECLNSSKSIPEVKEPLIENKKISNISNIKEISNNHTQLNILPINVLDYVKRNQNIRIASVESLSKTNPIEAFSKRPTTKLDKPVVLDEKTLPILQNRPITVTAIKVVPPLNLTKEDNNKEKSNENAVAPPPAKKLRIASGSDKNGTNILETETHTKLTSPADPCSTLNIASEEPITTAKQICLQQHKPQTVFQPFDLTLDEDLPVTVPTSALKKIFTPKRLSEECVYTSCQVPVKVPAIKVFPTLNLTNEDSNTEKSNENTVTPPPAKKQRRQTGTMVLAIETHTKLTPPADQSSTINKASEQPITPANLKVLQPLEKSNKNAVIPPLAKKLRKNSGFYKNKTNVFATETKTKLSSPHDPGSTLNKASEELTTTVNRIYLQKHKLQTVFQPLDLTLEEDLPATVSTSPIRKNSTSKSKRLSEDDECVYTCKVFPTLDLTIDEDDDDDNNTTKTEKQIATTSENENKKNDVNVICLDDDDDDSVGLYEEVFNYLSEEDKH